MKTIHLGVTCGILTLLALGAFGDAQYYGSYGRDVLIRPQLAQLAPYPYSNPFEIQSQSAPVFSASRISADMPQNVRAISRGAEVFSFDMYRAIANAVQNYDANFVISPFSVWCLMLLVSEGSVGQTYDQIQQVLHTPNDFVSLREAYKNFQRVLLVNTTTVELAVNHALFTDKNRPIEYSYASILQNDYEADHLPVDYQRPNDAVTAINNHISWRTQGKIKNVVKPEDLMDAQLLLTSTIFFKGQWKFPFNTSLTKDQAFYRENNDYITHVPMMYQRNVFPFATINALDATVVELPYGKENRLCMLLILPRRNSTLTNVFENLRNFDIAKIDEEIHKFDNSNDEDDTEVELSLPRFNIDSDLELRTVLEYLGMKDVFDPIKANLSKMSRQPTYVSRVFHKAVIEVNEVGTVAAAVTGGTVSFKQTPVEIVFNRPFGFLITEKTSSTLLFAGQVRHPLV